MFPAPLAAPAAEATPGQFPFQAALYAKNTNPYYGKRPRFLSVCGGTLITPGVVMTAGKPAGPAQRSAAQQGDQSRVEVLAVQRWPCFA